MVTEQQLVQSDTKAISYTDQMKLVGLSPTQKLFQKLWVPVLRPTLPPRIAFVDLLKGKG